MHDITSYKYSCMHSCTIASMHARINAYRYASCSHAVPAKGLAWPRRTHGAQTPSGE